MRKEEFNQRFQKPGIPYLDLDMIPVLVTEEGVFSPGNEEKCLEFDTRDSAIAYWVDQGYKVFVLSDRRAV